MFLSDGPNSNFSVSTYLPVFIIDSKFPSNFFFCCPNGPIKVQFFYGLKCPIKKISVIESQSQSAELTSQFYLPVTKSGDVIIPNLFCKVVYLNFMLLWRYYVYMNIFCLCLINVHIIPLLSVRVIMNWKPH